jgi:arginine decarboxylase
MNNYGIDIWSNNDFIIDQDKIKINYKSKPSIYEIISNIRAKGLKGPLLLRFPHLIEKQIDAIYNNFKIASQTLNYKGKFQAVFPLKVNQFPNFIKPLLDIGEKYNYGLEAGSKAELLLAISLTKPNAPIFVNGFKDQEMIKLAFLSAQMNHDITLTMEGIDELESMLDVAKEEKTTNIPKIALRIKLHSSGIGIWAKSGGYNSKFGLTSTELLMAIKLLKKNDLLDKFTMIHFHIGSQLNDIAPLKKALREAGNIYADLKKLGAYNLETIDIGGGLGIEYSQHKENTQTNYSLAEYANDIIFMIQSIAKSKNVKEPNIAIESGRFIAASHAVLIAPVFELFSEEYNESELELKETNPPLIEELVELYKSIDKKHALEYLHDSVDHLNSILTLFDLGYVDLRDRSNSEILVNLIVKKVIVLLENEHTNELLKFKDSLLEKYLINFSIFQSMPDFWGLKQNFPVMPITKLDKKPTRSASLWDISCDSDGEIEFDRTNPLFLHSIDTNKEDYFLAFFLVGAYQEILGMKHNLFVHPTEATIIINNDNYKIKNLKISPSIIEILDDIDYDTQEIKNKLKENINNSPLLISKEDKASIFSKLEILFGENGYLKTVN